MLICKDPTNVLNSNLMVDNWKVEHADIDETGDSELIETYQGQVFIEKTEQQKYLGFTISSRGNNLININEMKKKSILIIRKIFNRLESLNLQNYYF